MSIFQNPKYFRKSGSDQVPSTAIPILNKNAIFKNTYLKTNGMIWYLVDSIAQKWETKRIACLKEEYVYVNNLGKVEARRWMDAKRVLQKEHFYF